MFPNIALAQSASSGGAASQFINNLATEIVNPIILLLVSLAILIFLWGMAEYIRGADSVDARNKGRLHMLWGIIGIFIMVSAYAIFNIVMTSVFGP